MSSYIEALKLAQQKKSKQKSAPVSSGTYASSSSSLLSGNKKLERKKPDPNVSLPLFQFKSILAKIAGDCEAEAKNRGGEAETCAAAEAKRK